MNGKSGSRKPKWKKPTKADPHPQTLDSKIIWTATCTYQIGDKFLYYDGQVKEIANKG